MNALGLVLLCAFAAPSEDEARDAVRHLRREVEWFTLYQQERERGSAADSARPAAVAVEAASWRSTRTRLARLLGERFAATCTRVLRQQREFELWQPLRARALVVAGELERLEARGDVTARTWWAWWEPYEQVTSRLLVATSGRFERRRALFEERRLVAERLLPRFADPSAGVPLERFLRRMDEDRLDSWSERLSASDRDASICCALLEEMTAALARDGGPAGSLRAGWLARLAADGTRGALVPRLHALVSGLFPLPGETDRALGTLRALPAVAERLERLASFVEDLRPLVGWPAERQRAIEALYDAPLRAALTRFDEAREPAVRARALKAFLDAFANQRREGYELSVLRAELRTAWQPWEFRPESWLPAELEEASRRGEDESCCRIAQNARPRVVWLQWWDEVGSERALTSFAASEELRIAGESLEPLGGLLLPPGHYVAALDVPLVEIGTGVARPRSNVAWHLCVVDVSEEVLPISFPRLWLQGLSPVAACEDGRRPGWFFEDRPLRVDEFLDAVQRHVRSEVGGARTTTAFLRDWVDACRGSTLGDVLFARRPAWRERPERAFGSGAEPPSFSDVDAGLRRILDELRGTRVPDLHVTKSLWQELGQRDSELRRAVEGRSGNRWLRLPEGAFLAALFLRKGNPYGVDETIELATPVGEATFAGPLREERGAPRRVVVRRIISPSAEGRR